jgi:hypothetical protein
MLGYKKMVMRKLITPVVLLLSSYFAYPQLGIKGGLNFANVRNASSINSSSRSGFNVGLFFGGAPKGLIASRTEILFSRQGYDYKSGTNTGTVNLDYIMVPQMMGINISKYFMLQAGIQMAYLINAKVDSTTNGSAGNNPYNKIMDYYNRFDYGFGLGAELHPFKGLLVGAKYNIGLGKIYKDAQSGQMPTFSSIDAKNNLVQIFVGWRFGK